MQLEPLIIFYKENKYLLSDDYIQLKDTDGPINQTLAKINEMYYDKMKVININFDSKIDAIILNRYKTLTSAELQEALSNYSKEFSLTTNFAPQVSKDQYFKAFNQCIDGIIKGDIYQVNLTFPFKGSWSGSSIAAFNHYHKLFEGNYHAHIPLNKGSLVSMSPELFISKDGDDLKTMPIKGTSKNESSDIENLINSPKENAELSMIVDLLRNDLNIIADIDSSRVTSHREILKIGNIAHTYSTIEAKTTKKIPEIINKMFPGGSISGCPKKRALEYIEKCELYPRSFYTGSLGWWHKDQATFNILIRSFMFLKDGSSFYHAGGGIVYESEAEKEYEEVMLKAQRINKL